MPIAKGLYQSWGMKTDNAIQKKSYDFAVRIVRLHRHVCSTHREYTLARQLLRSGTSIGANVEEAIGGQSKRDFIAKLSIAHKEARETYYWLRLLRDSELLNHRQADGIIEDCQELLRLSTSILKTSRERLGSD